MLSSTYTKSVAQEQPKPSVWFNCLNCNKKLFTDLDLLMHEQKQDDDVQSVKSNESEKS
jgi:hypothetical protein